MSWYPTPPNTPLNLRSGAKLISAMLSAREAANVVSKRMVRSSAKISTVATPLSNVSLTKTNMKTKYVKKPAKRDQKVATVGTVRRMLKGQLEIKQSGTAPFNAVALVNDAILCYNLTGAIVQGLGDDNRIGDTINLHSLTGNFRWVTDTEAAFYRMRILIGFSGEEYTTGGFVAGLTSAQLFVPGTVENLTAVVNTKAFTVLHDVILDINSQINAFADGVTHRVNIPLPKGKFNYQSDGSTFGKTRNLYVVVCPGFSAPGAADPPDNVGDVAFTNVVKFYDP